MFGLHIPSSAGEPIWWWLFWFVASLILYTVVMVWFYRSAKRATRKADPRPEYHGGDAGSGSRYQ